MNIYDTTKKWTDSMDFVLKVKYGKSPLKEIEEETGMSREEIFKRAKFLKIDNGKEKIKTLEEIVFLSECCKKHQNNINGLIPLFPNTAISSIYEHLESFKDLNNFVQTKDKRFLKAQKTMEKRPLSARAKNFLATPWSPQKLKLLEECLLEEVPFSNEDFYTSKFPDRSFNAIKQKAYLIMKENPGKFNKEKIVRRKKKRQKNLQNISLQDNVVKTLQGPVKNNQKEIKKGELSKEKIMGGVLGLELDQGLEIKIRTIAEKEVSSYFKKALLKIVENFLNKILKD